MSEEDVGEVRQEEILAARKRLDEARERRQQGLLPSGTASVGVQELPKEALQRTRRKSNETDIPSQDDLTEDDFLEQEKKFRTTHLEIQEENTTQSLEILWAYTPDPVDAYLLRYGYDQENLSEELRIMPEDIEVMDDPDHGQVCRFVLRNIPQGKRVYISLASERAGKLSAFSEILRLETE